MTESSIRTIIGQSVARRAKHALVGAVLITITLLSGVLQSAEPASNTTPATTAATTEERMICKRFTPTGSRISKRICRTKDNWEAMRKGGQKAMRDAMSDDSQVIYRPSG